MKGAPLAGCARTAAYSDRSCDASDTLGRARADGGHAG